MTSTKDKATIGSGFNALPKEVRQGRRRSSLEVTLQEIMDNTLDLKVRTIEFRKKQQDELLRADSIVKECDAMVTMHENATKVMAAVRWKRKINRVQSSSESAPESPEVDREEEVRVENLRRASARAEALKDLAKLQGMVTRAKQTNAMQTMLQVMKEMMRGHAAMLIDVWATNALGPRDLLEEHLEPQAEEVEEEEDDGYTCDLLIPEPEAQTEPQVQEQEPAALCLDLQSPRPTPPKPAVTQPVQSRTKEKKLTGRVPVPMQSQRRVPVPTEHTPLQTSPNASISQNKMQDFMQQKQQQNGFEPMEMPRKRNDLRARS